MKANYVTILGRTPLLTYDPETSSPLKTMSGAVAENQILATWDLMDGNGSLASDGPLAVEFTLPAPGGTEKVIRYYGRYRKNPHNNVFAVAWGNDGNKERGWQDAYNTVFAKSVVDYLGLWEFDYAPYVVVPYKVGGGSDGNYNILGGGSSFRLKDKKTKRELLDWLKLSGNFIWSGHGWQNVISTTQKGGVRIEAAEVAGKLGNPSVPGGPMTARVFEKPYKLVILVCCNAYSKEWADAFGIAEFHAPGRPGGTKDEYLRRCRSQAKVENYAFLGKIPQAFVGWPVKTYSSGSLDELSIEGEAFATLFRQWQAEGWGIGQCMEMFTKEYIKLSDYDWDGIANNEKWCLSGCWDLTTEDRNP